MGIDRAVYDRLGAGGIVGVDDDAHARAHATVAVLVERVVEDGLTHGEADVRGLK